MHLSFGFRQRSAGKTPVSPGDGADSLGKEILELAQDILAPSQFRAFLDQFMATLAPGESMRPGTKTGVRNPPPCSP